MEGNLLVPPDRGTIIGRALWKSRYVIVGPYTKDQQQSKRSAALAMTLNRTNGSRSAFTKAAGQSQLPADAVYISVYKSKDDPEPIQQHAITSVTDCQVHMLAHRKQGPVLPTLVVSISPDPVTDKLRKRRSSRTAGLTSTKETTPSTLWFRTADDSSTLNDWARAIQALVQQRASQNQPTSPITPMSPTFINPFAPRPREGSDYYPRPPSGNPASSRSALQHKPSNQTYSSRERPITFSDSPSLRSKRSDISSHASSMHPASAYTASQNYSMYQPADLPSPAATVEEYQGQFIEGWTTAQGRASTLSSPVRGRGSISSQQQQQQQQQQPPPQQAPPIQPTGYSSSPLIPRETILDRAFQLRIIPGSDQEVPGEDSLSSIARFDALMREADERRKLREAQERTKVMAPAKSKARASIRPGEGLKSAWEVDEESDEHVGRAGSDDSDSDLDIAHEHDLEDDDDITQRALEYVASRNALTQAPARSSGTVRYDPQSLAALDSNLNSGFPQPLRPQTAHGPARPAYAQRTHSQSNVAVRASTIPALPDRGILSLGVPPRPSANEENSQRTSGPATAAPARLSFTEFTKRLSSTSSLLLVQSNASATNASSGSLVSSDPDVTASHNPLRPSRPLGESDRDGKGTQCGTWRGGVGVFGSEGGFL